MPDKWTAFLLSLVMPGAGQLLALHWSFPLWAAAAALAGTLPGLLDPLNPAVGLALRGVALAAVALCSAEHAKRCREPRRGRASRGVQSRVCCGWTAGTAVRLDIEIDVPRPAAEVWTVVADLRHFLCIDPFHCRVVVLGPVVQQGTALALGHRAFGLTLWRFGRLLTWHEGRGYAFSDLSARGPRCGFPHVFFVTVVPTGPTAARLEVHVRGKWTARWLPRFLAAAWLHGVCREHARLLRDAFSGDACHV